MKRKFKLESLREFLEFLSPDSKIEIVHNGIIFTGYSGEAQELPRVLLEGYDVVGTKFQHGILAIYVC